MELKMKSFEKVKKILEDNGYEIDSDNYFTHEYKNSTMGDVDKWKNRCGKIHIINEILQGRNDIEGNPWEKKEWADLDDFYAPMEFFENMKDKLDKILE